jgi:hypothetical protein
MDREQETIGEANEVDQEVRLTPVIRSDANSLQAHRRNPHDVSISLAEKLLHNCFIFRKPFINLHKSIINFFH